MQDSYGTIRTQVRIGWVSRLCVPVLIALAILPSMGAVSVFAQQAQTVSEKGSVTGAFTIQSGDPKPGTAGEHQYRYTVTDDGGQDYTLRFDEADVAQAGGVRALDGKRVTVQGTITRFVPPDPSTPSLIDVLSIDLAPNVAPSSPEPQGLTGQQKFATIMCRFADSSGTSPVSASYMNGLLGDAAPGIGHFWRENSYNLINNLGSVVVDWHNLPSPRSTYITGTASSPVANLGLLADDCAATADDEIDYTQFVGINLVFNQLLDSSAWGGTWRMTLDGVQRTWGMTWMPPWGILNQRVLGHEMGHAYGLPHSSGNYGLVYDSRWDVMSGGGAVGPTDPTYGALGTHTIAYHKDELGWIPAVRKFTVAPNSCQVLTIDYLSQVPPTSGTYLMAQIPVGTGHFFTVEARRNFGYDDGRIPGQAIVIHDVLTSRREPAHVMDATVGNTNDAGAMWLPGETFVDGPSGVSVAVLASTANGWSVQITKGSGTCVGPPVNDAFASSVPIEDNPDGLNGSTVNATKESGEPNHVGNAGGKSVWYSFTPLSTGTLALDTATSSFDTLLAVYTGNAVGSLTPVASNNDDPGGGTQSRIAAFPVTSGTKYSIVVDGVGGTGGATKLSWVYVPNTSDTFASAMALSGPSGSAAGTTLGATKQPGEPDHAGDSGGHSIWYRYTPPTDGTLSLDTVGSPFDTLLALYTGSVVNALGEVDSNDDIDTAGGNTASTIGPVPVIAGVTYSIAIDGWAGDSGPTTLNWTFTGTAPPPGGRFNPLTPARILDTRTGAGGITGVFGPAATVNVQVSGQGGVPATGAVAVVMNVTVTSPSAASFLTLFPTGSPKPLASTLNFAAGKTIPNLAVVGLGTDGKVAVYNSAGSTHVIVDVAGWYSGTSAGNDGRYQALDSPARLLDTRTGGGSRIGPGGNVDVQVSGAGGVPAGGVAAAVVNIAVTATTTGSFLTAYPKGEPRPLAANLNWVAGETVSNRAIVKVGADGKVSLYNYSGLTHVIVDVVGWFTDASVAGTTGMFTTLTPTRVLDTRIGTGGVTGLRLAGSTVDVQLAGTAGVPASGASAVVLNAIDVGSTGGGWLTIFPAGTARPLVADLNYMAGEVRANLVVVKLDATGKVSLYTSATSHVVFDVAGWIS